jgi:Tfp pilus assembly protein PilN
MINLLPNDYRQSLRYARRNSVLMKWLIAVSLTLALSAAIVAIGSTYLKMETKNYAKLVETTKQELKDQDLEETLAKVQNISGNLKLINQVLSKQVIFSELIKQIGAVMPPGSVLSDIEISQVSGGIDLKAQAQNYESATQIQINLSDPNNKLFDKVDIVTVDCQGTSPDYPCTVTLRALFTKNNPYLFVNKKATP